MVDLMGAPGGKIARRRAVANLRDRHAAPDRRPLADAFQPAPKFRLAPDELAERRREIGRRRERERGAGNGSKAEL